MMVPTKELIIVAYLIGLTSQLINIQGPVFDKEPNSTVIFNNDAGVFIHCSSTGLPRPVVQWKTRDGSVAEDEPKLRKIYVNGTMHLLPFDAVSYQADVHSTMYACYAGNPAGMIRSRNVTVHAVTRQSYDVTVNDKDAIRDNTAVLKCEIPTFVKPYVHVDYWLRNSEKLIAGAKFGIFHTGELHIRNVSEHDVTFKYWCITKHSVTGETVQSARPGQLRLRDVVSLRPTIVDIRSRIRLKAGTDVELPCAAEGAPVPSYRWHTYSEGVSRPVIPGGRFSLLSGSLRIVNVSRGDGGSYMCEASNQFGTARATTDLLVTETLSVILQPRSQTVDFGNEAFLECTVSGYPINSLTWYKNGRLLRSTNVNNNIFKINNVGREDKGMYQCFTANDDESAQAVAEVKLGVAPPVIISAFTDKVVYPGSSLTITCVTSGNPLPAITWYLDNEVVTSRGRYLVQTQFENDGDLISSLTVTNIRVEDGGLYKCVSRNTHNEAIHSGRINVYGNPVIRKMPNVTAVANRHLTIKCYVSGYPIKSIVWEKDGKQLPENHRQQVLADGILSIFNVHETIDAGKYTCTAKNPQGQGMQRAVHVAVKVPPTIDPFEFRSLQLGRRASVMCSVSGGDPPVRLSWEKDGHPFVASVDTNIVTVNEFMSTLAITNLRPLHNGNYTCVATNDAATVSYTAELVVDVPPAWIVEPRDSSVIIGESVLIDCQTTGTPTPTVNWKKHIQGADEERFQYINLDSGNFFKFHNGSLLVANARESDMGNYLCQASNGVPPDLSKLISLTVHVPAKFEETFSEVKALVGESTTIECSAKGDKPMSILWSIGGTRLENILDTRIVKTSVATKTGITSKLAFESTRRDDSTQYTCIASNSFGHDSTTILLKVLEKPEQPTEVKVNGYSSKTVQISWSKTYSGNQPILKYIVEIKNLSDTWEKSISTDVSANLTATTLSNLHPAFTYQIRVFAENSLGTSLPSEVMTVTTEEEIPSGPPWDVSVHATGSESILVEWKPPYKHLRNGKIKGYYVGYRIYNTTTAPFLYHTVSNSNKDLQKHELTNLKKYTIYSIVVSAFNRRGTGPRSEEEVTRTLEDVPSRPPQTVSVAPLSSNSIIVEWLPPPFEEINGILQGYRITYSPMLPEEYAETIVEKKKRTTALSATLYGLDMYTNYSIQVAAYTRVGDGVRSKPVYARTFEDIPDRPAGLKAYPSSSKSIIISWLPPSKPNGIITKYTLYTRYKLDGKQTQRQIDLPPSGFVYEMDNLLSRTNYSFWVTAWTTVGEGKATTLIRQSPSNSVAAKIISFGQKRVSFWNKPLLLPCFYIGYPKPIIKWLYNNKILDENQLHGMVLLQNGSLMIHLTQLNHAGEYSCHVSNVFGKDEIKHVLIIRGPPLPPTFNVLETNSSSFTLSWKTEANGGSHVTGGKIFYKREFEEWQSLEIAGKNSTTVVAGLSCGTVYQVYMMLSNRIGLSDASSVVSTTTFGTVPVKPVQDKFILLNSTHITLNLSAWRSGGCPLKSFDINYRAHDEDTWKTVANTVDPTLVLFRIMDFERGTVYHLKVIAHNEAGSTTAEYEFTTLSFDGTLRAGDTETVYTGSSVAFHENVAAIVPVILGFILVVLLVIAAIILCKRRRRNHYPYKENNTIKKDLTAESALIADNMEKKLKDSTYSVSPEHMSIGKKESLNSTSTSNRNLNLNLHLDPVYGQALDRDINPYATYILYGANQAPSYDVVANFPSPGKGQNHIYNSPTQEPMLPQLNNYAVRDTSFSPDNQVLTVSPVNSGGEIRYILGGAELSKEKPSSQYYAPVRRTMSPKGTIASSNYDELREAYDHYKMNPAYLRRGNLFNVPAAPMIQEQESVVSLDPGIVRFTQSPPCENEQRESHCIIPSGAVQSCNQKRPSLPRSLQSPISDSSEEEESLARKRPRRRRRSRSHSSNNQTKLNQPEEDKSPGASSSSRSNTKLPNSPNSPGNEPERGYTQQFTIV